MGNFKNNIPLFPHVFLKKKNHFIGSLEGGVGFPNIDAEPGFSVEGCVYELPQDCLPLLDTSVGFPKVLATEASCLLSVEGLSVKCLFERGVFVYFLLYIALCQVGFTSVVV